MKFEQEFAAERERLESLHSENMESLTQSSLAQQKELQAQHKREMDELKSRHDAVLRTRRSNGDELLKKELETRLQEAKLHYEVEFAKKLTDKDAEVIAIKANCEKTIEQINEAWETRQSEALKSCRRELESSYDQIIDQLKLAHHEELRNNETVRRKLLEQVKVLSQDNESKREAIESKNTILETLSKECDHHLHAMEACKRPYIDQIEELNEEIKKKQLAIRELEGKLRSLSREVSDAGVSRKRLETDHQEEVRRLQAQLSEITKREEGTKTTLASLQNSLDGLKRDNQILRDRAAQDSESLRREKQKYDRQSSLHQSELNDLRAQHSTALSAARSELQSQLKTLQGQYEALQGELAQKTNTDLFILRQEHHEATQKASRYVCTCILVHVCVFSIMCGRKLSGFELCVYKSRFNSKPGKDTKILVFFSTIYGEIVEK